MKKTVLLLAILIAIVVVVYNYVYKGQRNIQEEKVNYSVSLLDLKNNLKKGDLFFNKKYLDKTIEISGLVTQYDSINNFVEIDTQIFVALHNKLRHKVELNKKLQVKARFIGYDDLLENFKFDQGAILN